MSQLPSVAWQRSSSHYGRPGMVVPSQVSKHQIQLQQLGMNVDDEMSTPWPTNGFRRYSSDLRNTFSEAGNGLASVSRPDSSFWVSQSPLPQEALFASSLTEVTAEHTVKLGLDEEKVRRLFALQRRRCKEVMKAEKEAFNLIMQRAEGSMESILLFTEFRRSLQREQEKRNQKMIPWLQQSLVIRIEQIIEEEREGRQAIVTRELRVRAARRRVEWLVGAKMRYERAIELIVSGEERGRSLLERAEMRRAREITALSPYVTLNSIRILGQCPFLSIKDCPFHLRGEGEKSKHYEYSLKGTTESFPKLV
ncbi:hypothetical protein ERJ75_000240400 [Trypanosoma vivax]|uniref:Uncharacterized protein n=1 Tax=Trypanosoma vivax (strain Y486) TaxID=1055687 RepID=F9WV57_TRYVY|nr:hypothetical protein TRVL_05848 [Trypanosoma vivax]KAH8618801.1 hypothetical protein ERJ75_000240400 [Trypanosoma vivax]CCD21462.1 hypothetical protein, conserved [Trypanosoma vivax Y486]|eukprot:CCD21462.1 hypothetical protein, conserved [Trypanosoma vivax Y486]